MGMTRVGVGTGVSLYPGPGLGAVPTKVDWMEEGVGEVEGRMEDRTECKGWGRCPGRRGGVWDTGCTLTTNKGAWPEADTWDATRRRACQSARCLGEMQRLQPGPVCTCPEEEGGGRPSHNAERPASGQPRSEGKEVCLGIRTVRLREGGSRKEQAGGKVVGLEP